ncbi:hypothetical protein CRYUN_Cryun29cG0030700 [Craigia yunnanensis]
MMLLDGCFIVQLIRMRFKYQLRDPNDLVFKVRSLFKAVCLDLLLVENQLPFFVIWELYSMLEIRDQYSFKKRVFEFFSFVLPKKLHPREDWKSIEEINHLLHFIHHCSHHDPTNSNKNRNQSVRWHSIGCTMKLEEAGIKNMNQSDRWNSVGCATKLEEAGIKNMNQSDWNSIGCATKLEEAGMKFEMSEGNSLFDIRFESGSGTMKIPLITVDDSTEGLLRNHVAFEQIHPGEKLHHVTDFLVFMDNLIDSAKDVEILRQHKIIENILGDNEAVATMFNRLGHHVGFSSKDFYYSQVFNQINHYCSRCQSWKKFIAYLKRNYFNSPWAPLVSVVAAFTLLLLAVLQTLYTILSYTKQNA